MTIDQQQKRGVDKSKSGEGDFVRFRVSPALPNIKNNG